MKKYLQNIKDLILLFLSFVVYDISRVENASIDALSKLVASLPANLRKETFLEVLKKSSLKDP